MEDESTFKNIFARKFEPALLAELESKSILMKVSRGETLLQFGKPVIFASVYQYEGQLQIVRPGSACLRCVWPEATRDGIVAPKRGCWARFLACSGDCRHSRR